MQIRSSENTGKHVTKVAEQSNMPETSVNMFNEVQPFLLYIERIIFDLLGSVKHTFPYAWKRGSLNEISYWTSQGVCSVQEAVTLSLNYYRCVMEEFFWVGRNSQNTYVNSNNIWAQIYRFMNEVENIVWHDERYEFRKPIKCESMHNSVLQDLINVDTIVKETVDTSDISCDTTNSSCNTFNYVGTNDANLLLRECIDEEMEDELLSSMVLNEDILCQDNDNSEVDITSVLLELACDVPVPNTGLCLKSSFYESRNGTSVIQDNVQTDVHVIDNAKSKHEKEVNLFCHMVENKYQHLVRNFTLEQSEMLQKTIDYYSDFVFIHDMCAEDAFQRIEQVADNVSKYNNIAYH